MPATATSMVVVSAIAEVREAIAKARSTGARIGFVPTMGALHDGHLALIANARRRADLVVLSIFVNPLQFAPNEDLSKYPRPVAVDERLARDAGVDILFRPEVSGMYLPHRSAGVSPGKLAARWEGEVRPGHFDGVLTVVAKLFNIVQPDFAVFGRKDLQQATLVRAMARDLDMPLAVDFAPIVRESDGLALSSRNGYLGPVDRQRATVLSRSLMAACAAFAGGARDTRSIEDAGKAVLAGQPEVIPDYFAVIDPETFERVERATSRSAAIVAARVGPTRLIDNMTLSGDDQD